MDADPLDHAATITQEAADREIRAIRANAARIDTTNPAGDCWFCGDEIGNERRFCDFNCCKSWSREHE